MGWPVSLPSSSRLVDWGHSWVSPPPYPYAANNIATGDILGNDTFPWVGENWPFALRDALGIGSGPQYYKTYQVPSVTIAATTTTYLDLLPDDCTIDAVYYVPNAAITTNASNYRQVLCFLPGWFANAVLGIASFTAGTVAVGQGQKVWSMNDKVAYTSGAGQGVVMPYAPVFRGISASATQINQPIVWQSQPQGSGQVDPGGTVIIRYGTRYRNYGVGGAALLASTAGWNLTNGGNWVTCLHWSPYSRTNAVEVNTTAAISTGNTSVACSALAYPIPSGSIVTFAGGLSITTNATANFGATSIAFPSYSGTTIPAGSQGHAAPQNGLGGGAYETLSPTGLHVWTHGVNDADGATQDVNAWQETVRAVIARCLSPAWLLPGEGNFVYTAGGGTWGTVPTINGAWSNIPFLYNAISNLGEPPHYWSGTVSGSPSVAISIGPAFEGGTVDLMFIAPAGASLGVAGTVTVDGGTPPQGTVTLNSSGVSTSGLLTQTQPGTIAAAASTTIAGTSTNFTTNDIGKLLTATGGTGSVPAGTIITAVASTTSITVNNTVTVSGATAVTHQFVPMVKRITGLAAGAHTITFTVTGSDSVPNSMLMVYGLGLESQNPLTPVLWCNIARCPSQNSTQKTNSTTLNTASSQVIKGTYTPLAGNTAEPAMPTSVVYVDIDTLLQGATTNTFFLWDGLHLNSRGHRLMARTLFGAMQANFSPDQLISR